MYDMKRKLVTLAIWSVLFAACSQSEYTRLEENQKEVRFSIYQSQMSRAGKVCFNVGDSIFLQLNVQLPIKLLSRELPEIKRIMPNG